MVKTVKMPTNYWYGDDQMEISFPNAWDVREKRMPAHDMKALTDAEIRLALNNPIGSKTISKVSEGKKTATIVFDDLTRGTTASRVIPFMIEELHKGGIKDENITFIAGLGAHTTMNQGDWRKKIGEDIVENYLVFNHNVYDHFIEKGTTSYGTPVEVNREFATADVKLGIGGIITHGFAGYGGGAKIVLPGVVSLKTIETNHKRVAPLTGQRKAGFGVMATNEIRLDMEETARLAGLDIKVDMVYNQTRLPVGLFVGDVVQEHRAGVEFAKKVLTTVSDTAMDVVVSNSYPNEAGKANWAINASLKEGGDAVIIHNAFQGEGHHYVYGQFGREHGGHLGGFPRKGFTSPFPKAKRVIYVSKWQSKRDNNPTCSYVKTWNEALELIKQDQGEKAKVAVYPYASIQQPPFPPNY